MNKCMEMLLKFGVNDGFLSEPKFSFIPEVMILAPKLCQQVYKRMPRPVDNPMVFCGFCSYVAIGTTYLWQNDFDTFQKADIVSALEKPRGFDYMDEYITDMTGFNHSKIEKHLKMAAIVTVGNTENAASNFGQCLETMFHYGMVLEMNKLGLK